MKFLPFMDAYRSPKNNFPPAAENIYNTLVHSEKKCFFFRFPIGVLNLLFVY